MSDLEAIKAAFTQAGIAFSERTEIGEADDGFQYAAVIEIKEGIGYMCFYAEFYFDRVGKCIGHGVFE